MVILADGWMDGKKYIASMILFNIFSKRDRLRVRFPLEKMKYLIFPCH